MKNAFTSIRDQIVKRYTVKDNNFENKKSTDINILLNRVKQDQKLESRKKLLFTAVTSLGVLVFGVLIF
ncbi:hypothetical protein OA104_01220 [Candidatus Pelagibacter sp.]|nr:hypothetical protein [Candidatus Pelagibacter sp.]